MKIKKEIFAIYIFHSIDGLANSLIGIFIPIYLLTLGYSLVQVIIYYLIQTTVLMLSTFVAGFIGSKFGINRMLLIRLPFLLISLFLLYSLPEKAIPIYAIALFQGFQSALYWTALNILFTQKAESNSMGRDLGRMYAWPQIASIFAPLLGGIIIIAFSFKILIGIALAIFAISYLPLLLTRPAKISFKFEFNKGVKLFRKYPKYFYAEIMDNFGEETEGFIWPVFVYLSLGSITSVGTVGTLLSLSSFVFTLYIGRLSDKFKKNTLIKAGAILLLLVWLARFAFGGALLYYVFTVLAGIFAILFLVPYHSRLFKLAKRNKIDEFFIFREVPVWLGRLAMLILALVFVGNFKMLFPIAGLVYLYFLFF